MDYIPSWIYFKDRNSKFIQAEKMESVGPLAGDSSFGVL